MIGKLGNYINIISGLMVILTSLIGIWIFIYPPETIPPSPHNDNATEIKYLIDSSREKINDGIYTDSINNLINAEYMLYFLNEGQQKVELNASIQMLLGDAYCNLSKIRNKKINAKNALRSYNNIINNLYISNNKYKVAELNKKLGIAYCLLSEVEDKKNNLLLAIKHHEIALNIEESRNTTLSYAAVRDCLGIDWMYFSDIKDSRINLLKAIDNHSQALSIRQKDSMTTDDAQTQNNLGIAYRSLARIEHDPRRLETAKEYLNMSLRNITDGSQEQAKALNDLGLIYYSCYQFSNMDSDIKDSQCNYFESLKLRNKYDYPIYYSDTLLNIAIANISYSELFSNRDEKIEMLNGVIKTIDDAIKIKINESIIDYALARHNKGITFLDLFKITNEREYLNNAKSEFEGALKIASYAECTLYFALTNLYLGNVYLEMSETIDCKEYTHKAANAYTSSKSIYNLEDPIMLEHIEENLDAAKGSQCY